jgi:hypothetical protein
VDLRYVELSVGDPEPYGSRRDSPMTAADLSGNQPDIDVSVTLPGLDEISAQIKAITSSPGWGRGLPYYGKGAPGNTRGPRWTAEDAARHSALIRDTFGERAGKTWQTRRRCCVCRQGMTVAWLGRTRRYCSDACRQRAYRRRTPPTTVEATV